LLGQRIVMTRSRAQAQAFCALLEAEGAEVVAFPTIRLVPPEDYGPVDQAILRLGKYNWVVFTSQNGVTAFLDRLQALGRDPRALRGILVAAIGPGTGAALRTRGVDVALAPAEFRAEALVEAFARAGVRGASILLPRAEVARSVLPDGLRRLGAQVDVVAVYRTEVEHDQDPHVRRRLLDGALDAVTFTSPSTVRNFLELLGPDALRVLRGCLVVCIGPVTAAAAGESGIRVDLVADTYSIPGLVAALRTVLGSRAQAAQRDQPPARETRQAALPLQRRDEGEGT
jgi:uroporphyrinogen III methyltransferase / synthase